MIPPDLNIDTALETIGWENAFAAHASIGERATLLRRLIALYRTTGQTTVLDKINVVTGRLMRDVRICNKGLFWIDGQVTNEISFIDLQYTCCLAFYELGRYFGNETMIRFATMVLDLTDPIADACSQKPVEVILMRKRIAELADGGGEGKVMLPGDFGIYPFISLLPARLNDLNILHYFSFTVFTLKDILEEKNGSFAFPAFDIFFEKARFANFLEQYKHHLTATDLTEIEGLHEYELYKMNLQGCFLGFNEMPASSAVASEGIQLHPKGRIFTVSRNKSISIRGTILEGFPADGSVYTVFIYPDLNDRRVKEEILTDTDEMILMAFSRSAKISALINELTASVQGTGSPLTKPEIRRRIRLFEKSGVLVPVHL